MTNETCFQTNSEHLTYFKLDPTTSGYEGDIRKGCALSSTEIDTNFHYLRGSDIKDVVLDDATKNLKITRVNGDVIWVTGFTQATVFTDETLKGIGSQLDPIGLSDETKSTIATLTSQVASLQEEINRLTDTIKNVIWTTLAGTPNQTEIVQTQDGKIRIGFSPEAFFMADELS